jgi:alginate O-acetyltransferase complex protein AlgI
MGFNTAFFLLAFLPATLIGYWVVPRAARNVFLLCCSLFFYSWGEPKFVFVAIASAAIDWVLGWELYRTRPQYLRKLYVTIGILNNIGVLFAVKYLNFAIANANLLLAPAGLALAHVDVALPIGISFIAFEKITYIVDLYRGRSHPAESFFDYFLYVFFFPKLLAGPIVKYHDIADQLNRRFVTMPDVSDGLARFAVGLGKKVLIADTVGKTADAIFSLPATDLSFSLAWLGALAFTVQIFFDFSGYSDMAIGIARVFGFRLLENFRQPYTARNFIDFWQRWHISLSSWIREYLYVPLGGNRISPRRTYVNLLLCFLASGLWHGANWTFIVWGLYHGTFLILDRTVLAGRWLRVPTCIRISTTFVLVVVGWVIFRCPTISQAGGMLMAMLEPWRTIGPSRIIEVDSDAYFFLSIGMLIAFMPFDPLAYLALARDGQTRTFALIRDLSIPALMFLGIGWVLASTFHPFIYFRF